MHVLGYQGELRGWDGNIRAMEWENYTIDYVKPVLLFGNKNFEYVNEEDGKKYSDKSVERNGDVV